MPLNEPNSADFKSQNVTTGIFYNTAFVHVFWLSLCLVACIAAIGIGTDTRTLMWSVSVAVSPVILSFLGSGLTSQRLRGAILVFSWAAMAVLATAYTGGVFSPLSVYLALGPLTALALGEKKRAIEAAVFGAFGYLAAMILNAVSGQAGEVTDDFRTIAGLGALIGVIQIGVLAGLYGAGRESSVRLTREITPVLTGLDLLADAPAVVIDLGRDGRIRQVVGNTTEILGVRRDSLVGHPIYALARPGEEKALDRAISKEAVYRFSPVWNHGRRLEMRVSPARDGQRVALLDVADIERREQSLNEQSEQARDEAQSISTYFASLGHELRTPLNAVLGFSDMLKSEVFGEIGPRNKEQAEMIHEGGQRLQLLVDDLLDAAKNRAGRLQIDPVDMDMRQSALDAIHMMRAQAKRAQIDLRLLEGEEVWALADARAVSQIWLNLISNALKFSPPLSAVSLRVERLSDRVRLSVTDEGEGLSEEEVEQLGNAFTQASNSKGKVGTGLGLSTVKTYAELHGGDFFIKSQKGRGTSVFVVLPLGDQGEDQDAETGQ